MQLAFNPDSDPEVTDLLEKFDWFIVPSVNPDGYFFSHSSVRRSARSLFIISASFPSSDKQIYSEYHVNIDKLNACMNIKEATLE